MAKGDWFQMRIEPFKKAEWAQAARAEGLSLSRWVERAADDELAAFRAREAVEEDDPRVISFSTKEARRRMGFSDAS